MKTPEGEEVHYDEFPALKELKIPRLDVRDYCGTWAWVHSSGKKFPFMCGSASCGRKECRHMYYTRRIRLVSSLIDEYDLNKFFTLTLDGKDWTLEDAWRDISYVWSKMRKRLKRKYPGFLFVAVLEQHKDSGFPHIHGFTNTYIDSHELSMDWRECGGGIMTDIRGVSTDPEEYVTKELRAALYVGKENLLDAQGRLEANQRSIWRSTKMKAKFELDTEGSEWVLYRQPIYKEVTSDERETGEFVEKARWSISEQSPETGSEDVETEVEAYEPGEDKEVAAEASSYQRRNQKGKE